MYAAILAGGVGSRLWPRSRQTRPKQFTDITGSGRTMIQETARRLEGLVDADRLYVITGSQYARLAAQQLPQIPPDQIIVEPNGRNTGPAIGLACVVLQRRDPDAILAVLPADHVITQPERFRQALAVAGQAATAGYLVTLGIEPTFPHTGYGYIKAGPPLALDHGPVYQVELFTEKPNRSAAEAFLAEGGYYWNGGIFVGQVRTFLEEFARQLPQVYERLLQIQACLGWDGSQEERQQAIAEIWAEMPSISMDYGVMEGARQVAVVPMQAGWSDVGSWDALEAVLEQDESSNYVAKGEILTIDSCDNIVYSDKTMVALIGVRDLVVVDAGDTLLIGHKAQMQRVKEIVETLRAQGRSELL